MILIYDISPLELYPTLRRFIEAKEDPIDFRISVISCHGGIVVYLSDAPGKTIVNGAIEGLLPHSVKSFFSGI